MVMREILGARTDFQLLSRGRIRCRNTQRSRFPGLRTWHIRRSKAQRVTAPNIAGNLFADAYEMVLILGYVSFSSGDLGQFAKKARILVSVIGVEDADRVDRRERMLGQL